MKPTLQERIQLAQDVLKQLAADEYGYVRLYVAQHPRTPVDVLRQLAADEYGYVRLYVAHNSSLPLDSDTFQDLMIDPDPKVRAATMERLANHLTENH